MRLSLFRRLVSVSAPVTASIRNQQARQLYALGQTGLYNRPSTSPFVYNKSLRFGQSRAMSNKTKEEPTEEELLEKLRTSDFGQARIAEVDGVARYAKDIFEDLKPIHAAIKPNPKIVFEFPIHGKYCNLAGNFHGGAAATMFDIATTFVVCLINSDTFWRTYGVSRTLNCTYLAAAPAGIKVIVTCEIIAIGKRLTQMRGEMRDENGKLLVTCEHGKVNVDAKL